ncbi:MAG: ferritin family protein [Candidatus Rifleibacteriota bacterium]
MNLKLNSLDVLRAAVILEEKGEKFYLDAAKEADNKAEKLLRQLAAMEKMHARNFSTMVKALEETTRNDVGKDTDEEKAFLSCLTDDRIITEECAYKRGDSLETVIRKAMQLEKNSVFFYTALKDTLLKSMKIEAVDQLINEEVKHYRMLSQALNELTIASNGK